MLFVLQYIYSRRLQVINLVTWSSNAQSCQL